MSKESKSSLVGRELLAVAVVTGAIIFLMLWLVGDRSFIGSLIVGAVLGYVVHYVFASLKNDSYTPPGAMASSAPAPAAPTPAPTPAPAKPDVTAEPEATGAAPEPATPEATSSAREAAAPAFLSAPSDAGADDLKKIRGVGPKLEQTLNTLGVYHYSQIAGWTETEVAWVDDNLEGFKGRVTRDDWVAQARELVRGDGS